MSESKEKQTNGTPVESQTQNTSSKNLSTDTADNLHRSIFNIFIIVSFALMICLSEYFFLDSVWAAARSADKSYEIAKNEARSKASEFMYDLYTREHKVTTEVSISISELKEVSVLEVLEVDTVDYQIVENEEDKTWLIEAVENVTDILLKSPVHWLKIPGYGIYTVDLNTAEFIVDNERDYVLIRLPKPELTSITIKYDNVLLLYSGKGGLLKNSVKDGIDEARKSYLNAEHNIKQNLLNNKSNSIRAEESAKTLLTNFVKQLNPQIENLIVEVQFME